MITRILKYTLVRLLGILMGNLLLLASEAQNIIKVSTISQAKKILDEADKQTLILFDIDSTLTTPSDPYLQRQAIQQHHRIYKDYISSLSQNQYHVLNHLIIMESPSQLVEEDWPLVIKNIQKRGAKTLALTSSKTGAVGSFVRSFVQWRYQELFKLGIDFSSTFHGSRTFKELEDFNNNHPGIEMGIVCAGNKVEKGMLLQPIFQTLQWIPNTVIVIDDKFANLLSCKNILERTFPTIKFIGIHYFGMESIPVTITSASLFEKKLRKLVQRAKRISK